MTTDAPAIGHTVYAPVPLACEVIRLDYGVDGHCLGKMGSTACLVTVYVPALNETHDFAVEDLVWAEQGE